MLHPGLPFAEMGEGFGKDGSLLPLCLVHSETCPRTDALIGHVASNHGIWKCHAGWYWWLNGVGYSCSGYIVMREQHNKKPSMPAHHIGRNEDGCALDRREWSIRIRT
jgi:hypothetical protein